MTTDTSERSLELPIRAALTGSPCEPDAAPGAATTVPKETDRRSGCRIREAVDAGAIKPFDPQAARKLMRYVPFWA